MREALVEFLRARRALLVLDNGEQVVDALADLVETLLLACADLRVLVTTLFAGGFEMDAVERVCTAAAGEASLLDELSSLVDKSIVIREEPEGAVRFRMFETVRDYGREQLREAGEETAVRRRHLDWCRQLTGDERRGGLRTRRAAGRVASCLHRAGAADQA
ncbi:hypothetical protein [Nocardia nova]|uniref:hypothetical protein n=1 Tax=Nocardia nova TaxID=37330 RepID=UPI0018956715|nr:hypothetical protein [Nocardia nova]MBF6148618.1 hypothetical protein [Nocardia nova]